MRENCQEIEDLLKKLDDRMLHKKTKELAGTTKQRLPCRLTNNNNEVIWELSDLNHV